MRRIATLILGLMVAEPAFAQIPASQGSLAATPRVARTAGADPAMLNTGASRVAQPSVPAAGAQTGPEAGTPQRPPVYGANLFEGARGGPPGIVPSTDTTVAPGDRVSVRLWGAERSDEVTQVDPEGRIFVPGVGPIRVAGLRGQALQTTVEERVRQVYPRHVEVYAALLTRQPIGVFVAGEVRMPGRHLGNEGDSLLDWLSRAGGIEPERGSFRRVRLVRNGQTLVRADLYAFLTEGHLPAQRIQAGDTLVVERVGAQVSVGGDVRHAQRFELTGEFTTGAEIIRLARPAAGVTHAMVRGSRGGTPQASYLDLATFGRSRVAEGDHIEFRADQPSDGITVTVMGRVRGPTTYAVRQDTRLSELLDHIEIDPASVDFQAVHIRRASVAARQREALDQALSRLEQSVLTASSRTVDEATIRVREAELISDFVQRARSVTPIGRLVVSNDGRLSDLRLEQGDVVVLPDRTGVVMISGEVTLPQAVLHETGLTARSLLARAGGPTDRADLSRFILMRPNGSTVLVDGNTQIAPGEELVVLPKVDTKPFQMARDIVSVIYQIAVAAAVLVRL